MESTVMEVKGITKKYREHAALDNISLKLEKGKIYGFIGQNGAGKTTLIRLITGLAFPTSGEISLWGMTGEAELQKQRKRIGSLIESPALYPYMTAYQNMEVQRIQKGIPDKTIIDKTLELVGLSDTGKKKVRNFSLGMRQRLGIAIALCGNPDFLILDEPVNGLDPQGIIEIRELILKLNKEQGITVLISSHILDELAKLATHYGFIDKGVIIKEMSAEELDDACRKSIRMKVSDTGKLARIMDNMGIEYSIISDDTADVYSTMKFSDIAAVFAKEGCEIISMEEHDESLEGFYLSLLGGEANV